MNRKLFTQDEALAFFAIRVVLDEQYPSLEKDKFQPVHWDEKQEFYVVFGRDYIEFSDDLREFMCQEWPVREPRNKWDSWRPMTGTAKFIGTRIFGKKVFDAKVNAMRKVKEAEKLQGRKNAVINEYKRMLKAIAEFQATCERNADLIEGAEITITISTPSFCQEK